MKAFTFSLLFLTLGALLPLPSATLSTLVKLSQASGSGPHASLIAGSDGNFYGVAQGGGAYTSGTVFKVTPTGVLTVLVNFHDTNGGGPFASLLEDSDGTFYGSTFDGGAHGAGTIFKMTPEGVLTTLHSFNFTDGRAPAAALIKASDGNFYGSTYYGGVNDNGTLFKMTPSGALTTLYTFDGTVGSHPYGALAEGTDGNFYGTTQHGGKKNKGTIFKMTPGGILTVRVRFNTTNGMHPISTLIPGEDGSFYGTTYDGGTFGQGTVFKVTPTGALTTLVNFDGTSGGHPYGALTLAPDGNFYGTSQNFGGTNDQGTAFKMTPAGVIKTLANFNGENGASPECQMVFGNDGNLYGTTFYGGTMTNSQYGLGTIFLLSLGEEPQTITFPAISEQVAGTTINLNATASSGLPVAFSFISGPGILTGSSLKLTGAGTVVVAANQAGDDEFEGAPEVQSSFTVKRASQTITFPAVDPQPIGAKVALGATASSGLPVTYKVVGPGRISGNQLTVIGEGQVSVGAYQTGNTIYATAPVAHISFRVAHKAQTITFPPVAPQTVGNMVTLGATASSGLPVTYKTVGPATISGNVVTVTGEGLVSVGAYQAGDSAYASAPIVRISFRATKLTQTLSFPPVGVVAVGQKVTLGATSTSGLAVIYSSDGPVVISGNTATFTAKGSVRLIASQPGNATYAAARAVGINVLVR